jgi:poly-gamma-glutamate capsule biosynthesis protein CapA/YwtB (metallophosphatase superfamily)
MAPGWFIQATFELAEVVPVRNVLKGVGAALAVIALCGPLIFWPADEAQPAALDLSRVTVTVPPVVVVAADLPGLQTTTTTTTEVSAEAAVTTTSTTELTREITIAAVGDVLPHIGILSSARDPDTGKYDFWPIFRPIAPYLAGADYTVVNLETRLAGSSTGYTGYPRFNSPIELAQTLKKAGVDLAATANNHSLDRGWPGIVGTLDRLDQVGIAHVGTYRALAEKRTPLVVDINGIKVGFLNYTDWLNNLEPPKENAAYAVNTLDVDKVAEEAMLARMYGAEVVIAILHYGEEYWRQPSAEQIKVSQGTVDYDGLLSRGVDVIIGAHPHVVQPIVHTLQYAAWKANDTYVVYSLGNFVSAQRKRYTDSGLIAYVHIQKTGLRVNVTGVSYLPVYVQRSVTQYPVRYRILPVLPGLDPNSDVPLSLADNQRMDQVWEELGPLLYRPDELIKPLVPADIGL